MLLPIVRLLVLGFSIPEGPWEILLTDVRQRHASPVDSRHSSCSLTLVDMASPYIMRVLRNANPCSTV